MDSEISIRDFVRPYTEKSDLLAALSLCGTLAVYVAALLAGALWWFLPWVSVPAAILLAFAAVRLYVLQHDCGHASFFRARWLNDLTGYVLSVLTVTPYRVMQYNHTLHHAHLGNLDHREAAEVYTMTLSEWQAAPPLRRLWYRLYRNPLVMLPLGGAYTYLIAYRWPRNTRRIGAAGVVVHNALVLGYLVLIWALLGLPGLVILAVSAVLAGMIGVLLVYVGHNFEDTYWDRKPGLDFRKAAFEGASTLDLGWWWDLGTGNIVYHDLHHYNPSIPSYRLRQCQRDLPGHLRQRAALGWREVVRSFRLKLWDEERQKLVPFPAAHQPDAVPAE